MSESTDLFGAHVMGLSRLWRAEIDRRLKPSGLSEARWRALRLLANNGGELTQSKLAEGLGIRGPTLVSQLDLLESAGWVRRHSVPNDRRSKVVRLTAEAEPLVRQIDAVIISIRQELFADLDADAVQRCSELLLELGTRLHKLRDPIESATIGTKAPANADTTLSETTRPLPQISNG
ncbi:MAG: MarR family transcriptional regulator for hemolysin [Gammaproteobacteria bacterium]|jgi:MarR family transcriptional regulator for hemolysin